ncbi:MAG TPA: TauD/TfdA family dioxygenase [Acidimicrobiales bacterium]|jgi:taurine dioxygenase|nr:TauD/TfdA family dioxygenase [Acidimicrobiales bacterium]
MTDVIEEKEAHQRPRPMYLGDYPLMVGPFTHLVDEAERLAGLTWTHFEAARLSPTIGAELTGPDLRQELPAAVVDEIRQALYEYKVIFFRDQKLTSEQHSAFAGRFGELEFHPFIPSNTAEPKLVRFEKSAAFGGYENLWHHDVTWRECPSMGAVLHAVTVPPLGGDTLFSDMYAAYESLDDETRVLIDDMEAVHDFTRTFGFSMTPDQLAQMQEKYPSVRHPVVCTHEGTGRRHLYVNRAFTDHIVGLEPEESRALIDRLCRRADAPEHQCRFRWTPDAVAFWDNRAVQHYAGSDYYPQVRVMERASIVGSRPFR